MTDATTTPLDSDSAATHYVTTERLRLQLWTTPTSIGVVELEDQQTSVSWFSGSKPHPLLSVRTHDGTRSRDFDSLTGATSVTCRAFNGGIAADLSLAEEQLETTVTVTPEGPSLRFEARIANRSHVLLSVEIRLPWFLLEAESTGDVTGMVPIEIGSVRPLADGPVRNGGLFAHQTFACATSVFPLAHVGDHLSGSGIAIAGDPARGATQVLEAATDGFGCRSTLLLNPGAAGTLGPIHVSADDGRWQPAVGSFADSHPLEAADAPDWLRYAGAIYNPLAEGGGGIYQEEPTVSLTDRISSFDELPDLLAEARTLGTDILHLFDYWEKDSHDPRPAYWHKGNYQPRTDLGGEEALRRGVHAVRAEGGHVLMYLEPFIVYRASELGREHGHRIAALDPWTREPIATYPDNITTVPWDPGWRQHIVRRAEYLVGDIGADGIFLDSFGWQWNWVCAVAAEPVRDAEAWNRGVIELAAEVRQRIRRLEPEAVVVTEGLTGHLATAVDAGLDASFAWNLALNQAGILRSPVRQAYPQITFFSNGRDDDQMKQVFLAGHGLALSHRWLKSAELVRELVGLRRSYADALVDGKAAEVARSHDGLVAAILYVGTTEHVLVALNSSTEEHTLDLSSNAIPTSAWIPLTGRTPKTPTVPLTPGALAAWASTNQATTKPGPHPGGEENRL